MVFSSLRFFGFLFVLLAVLALPFSRERKKNILAVASCLFYAAWDYRYLALLILISVIDYICAARIYATDVVSTRKRWLWFSVVSNLAILGYFKYVNFFIDNLNGVLAPAGVHFNALHVLLPAGISFYTFKSMSYTIDVYRGHIEPAKSQLDYTTFVTFFPELIAGPIVRASVFLPQMEREIGPTWSRLSVGASIFLLGLTKKLLVADQLATVADPIFATPEIFSSRTIWMGVLAYTFQIYADFSGYSDMAIGTAKMIGYDLPENFNMPYLATNITEFWRRWHITLSSWLRDYLYIPLGGNRKGRRRTYINLMITMLLGGLWHGASWNFVLWGALHGVALAVHKWFMDVRKNRPSMPPMFGAVVTFVFVYFCWIPFRARTFDATRVILTRMFTAPPRGGIWYPEILAWGTLLIIIGHLLGAKLSKAASDEATSSGITRFLRRFDAALLQDPLSGWYVRLGLGTIGGSWLVTVWTASILYFGATNSSPFIYFQF